MQLALLVATPLLFAFAALGRSGEFRRGARDSWHSDARLFLRLLSLTVATWLIMEVRGFEPIVLKLVVLAIAPMALVRMAAWLVALSRRRGADGPPTAG